MSRWSGLGPAYDAHMRLWGDAQRANDAITEFAARDASMARLPLARHAAAWCAFARSWGLPQADGTVDVAGGANLLRTLPDEATIQGREQYEFTRDAVSVGLMLLASEADTLRKATTHYIAAPVVARLTAAAAEAEPEPLFPTDLQARVGFAVLEAPLLLPDLDPDTGTINPDLLVPVRAFSWAWQDAIAHGPEDDRRAGPGVMVTLYSTPDDHRAHYERTYRACYGRPSGIDFAGMARDALFATDVLPWAFGTPWAERATPAHQALTVPSSVAYWRRWFLTFSRFMWQTILVADRAEVPPKVARRWQQEARKRPLNDVAVLRLRRVTGAEWDRETGTGTPLDHRVLVRGHWRRQWCRSLGPARLPEGGWNTDSHRLVWIEEHWRGEGPIGPMAHATVVAR